MDGRIHAWRMDLADIGLAGQIFAPHYARPLRRGCGAHATLIWPRPTTDGDPISQLLPGEYFGVLEYAGGLAWGFAESDHVVGYVEAIALAESIEATHVVCEKTAPIAADASIGSPVIATLPMGSRLHGHESGACLATEYGCVPLSHLRRIGEHEDDAVAVAERLLGAPFLAGGRTSDGIDAGALIQLALTLCGVEAPRLLDQLEALGEPIPDGAPAQRGDLVFFDGGAGLMVDDLLMIHASAAAGKVCVEPASLFQTRLRRLAP